MEDAQHSLKKLDIKLFGIYPEAHCTSCSNFHGCGGQSHKTDNEEVKAALLAKFGERIQVSLVNIFSGEIKEYPEVISCIRQNGLRLPILMIDGRIALYGIDATKEGINQAIYTALAKSGQ